jgi:hypothetical protein
MELDVWAEYCDASEAKAKQFFDDMARDVREILEVHQKSHIQFTQKTYERAKEYNKTIREHSKNMRIYDIEDEFKHHDELYKIASKYTHPTSLLLGQSEWPQSLFDSFYVGGTLLCKRCLGRVERTILKRYPDFDV